MKKIGKVVLIIIVLLTIFSCIGSNVYATLTNPVDNPNYYKPSDNKSSDNTKFINIGNAILGTIRVLGTAISVITLMTLGIRYMLASTGDKALYKETFIPYLIGAVMVFAIPNIIGVIYDLVTKNIQI